MVKIVVCENEIAFKTRMDAISYVMGQIEVVPRREQERYIKVLRQLVNGYDVCNDEVSE